MRRSPFVFLVVLFILFGFLFTGCSGNTTAGETPTPGPPTNTPIPPTETPVPEVTIGDPERGRQIFENGGANEASTGPRTLCSKCHTVDGSDEKAHNGPMLQGISARAGETVPGLSAGQYIYQSIMDPKAYVVDGYPYMPLGLERVYSEEEIADLVAFLLTK